MNTSKHMILKNEKDITCDVTVCKYNSRTKKYDITFKNGKTYSCSYLSIKWLRDPAVLNPVLIHITHNDRELFDIQAIYVFKTSGTRYWRIRFANGSERSYNEGDLKIIYSCLSDSISGNCLEYLRQIAAINQLHSKDGEVLLEKQYEHMDFVGTDTALAVYLNPQKYKAAKYEKCAPIFPFGGNSSQFKAVNTALTNQISVIQGPPGTGKTQTILNIIANLLVQGKTVQIVSNNNSATKNVLDKLSSPKYGLGFLVATLGNSANKAEFIKNQCNTYPDISRWRKDLNTQTTLQRNIFDNATELLKIFEKQEQLAKVNQDLDALNLEIKYFEQYCIEIENAEDALNVRKNIKSDRIIRLWQEFFVFFENEQKVPFWYKFKSVILYGISNWNFFKNDSSKIITLLQSLFYHAKKTELTNKITSLEQELKSVNADKKIEKLTSQSMEYLKSKLFNKYSGNKRIMFIADDLWKNPNNVVDEYPVILSTTFSSRSSLGKDIVYDYLIMDEASQVDVATGALALSCARNVVIVGDTKQLPNVVSTDMKKRSEAIMKAFNINKGYSFTDNSFLQSVCNIITDVQQTLLREHYRCHPKIIGFCNQKFYNNELIIMTKDQGETDALSVFKTVVGNHRRDNFNQRQIDVVCQEAIPKLKEQSSVDMGIIAPYNDQVNALKKQIDSTDVEVATIHKFQGREKDTIILTPVDDVVTDFTDDSYMLNVAISRAKKRFCLVASGNKQPIDSNIRDLIDYIQYNNFEFVQSEIHSVFDYLYKQYTFGRLNYLKKHKQISKYDSENLMYVTIKDVLDSHSYKDMDVICHQPLNMLIRNPKSRLSVDECKYAMNTLTHLDFLIYNRINKKPILAIEVDGFHYHKEGTVQANRDKMKDHILDVYDIDHLRFPTNGSGEKEKIEQFLMNYINTR